MSFPVGFPARRPERWLMPVLALVMLALSFTHLPVAHAADFNPGCTNGVGKAAQLQAAVATANSNGAADTITLVSGCTYTLTETLTVTADGGNALTINGNGATISGDKKVRVITVEAATLNLNAVKIKDGAASGDYGGGLYLYNSTVTLTSSTVFGNTTTEYGGGIYNEFSMLTLTDSTVSHNTADYAGGIYNERGTVTLNSSKISGNTAKYSSGGIFNYRGTVTLTNSTISNNTASSEVGGIDNTGGTVTLIDSTVSNNRAKTGGGIHNGLTSTLTLTNSTVSGNTAANNGGGISITGGTVTLTNSTVSGNTAANNGGGIYTYSNTVTLTSSTIAGNTASYGGGIHNEGTLTLTNSTVSRNTASINGGGIYNFDGTMTLTNATLTENSSSSGGGGAIYNFKAILNLTRSIVANSPSGGNCISNTATINAAGTNLIEADTHNACNVAGLITADPMLGQSVGQPAYFPLLTGSPAIDAGGQGDCLPQDQRGAVRPQDGDGDGLAACDLGAYEKLATTGTQLLKNGGFEAKTAGQPLLSPWTLRQASGDGIVCNGASAGKCALLLTGGQGEKAVLAQNIKPGNRVFNPGDQLRLTLMFKGAAATRGKITLRVKYADNTPVQKVTIPLDRTYGGYEEQFAELYLTSGAVSQITLQVNHTSPKGKTYLDAISLRHRGALMLNTPLIDLPAGEMRLP